jgi:hypothetical protein
MTWFIVTLLTLNSSSTSKHILYNRCSISGIPYCSVIKRRCYIARVNTKRDWLICGHVTSNKCNVSRRATSEKLFPARPATYINKQNGGTTSIIRNYDFPSLCLNKECKREEKYTTGNRICCWNRLSRLFYF